MIIFSRSCVLYTYQDSISDEAERARPMCRLGGQLRNRDTAPTQGYSLRLARRRVRWGRRGLQTEADGGRNGIDAPPRASVGTAVQVIAHDCHHVLCRSESRHRRYQGEGPGGRGAAGASQARRVADCMRRDRGGWAGESQWELQLQVLYTDVWAGRLLAPSLERISSSS